MIASSDVIHTVTITIYLVEELSMNVEIRVARCLPSTANRLEGTSRVPVVTTNENGVPSEVTATELPIVVIEGAVMIDELGEVGDDSFIESDSVMASWGANEIAFKAMQAGEELLPDNSLGLNVTEGLQKGSLCHLLHDKEPLLDNVTLMRTADEIPVIDKGLLKLEAVPIVKPVEIVEPFEGLKATPTIKRVPATLYDDDLGGSVVCFRDRVWNANDAGDFGGSWGGRKDPRDRRVGESTGGSNGETIARGRGRRLRRRDGGCRGDKSRQNSKE